MTLLVTGGAGFIGCNFVRHVLRHTDARVVVLDKLTYAGRRENLADLDRSRFELVEGDVSDARTVRDVIDDRRPTAVVHLAAESHVDRSIDGPRAFVQTNVVGTFELIDAVRAYLAANDDTLRRSFRLVHVSTDEVFGSLGEEGAFSETTAYAPNSPYAASKAGADHLVRAYGETFRVPVIITSCSNNYGPYQFPEKLIPSTILNAIAGNPLSIYGNGSNVRDWLHVEDHCAALLLALERGVPGERYNIGGFGERTNLAVVDTICAALEEILPAATNASLARTSYAELKTFVTDRPGHDARYAIDSTKIRRELGWRPSWNFSQGIRETVRWYLANASWCEAVDGRAIARTRRGTNRGESNA